MITITDLVKIFQAMRPIIVQYERDLTIDSPGFFPDEWEAYYGPADDSFSDFAALDALNVVNDNIPWQKMAEKYAEDGLPVDRIYEYYSMAKFPYAFEAFCFFTVLIRQLFYPKLTVSTRIYRNKWDYRGDWEPMGGDASMIHWYINDANPFGAIEIWKRKKVLKSFNQVAVKVLPDLKEQIRAAEEYYQKHSIYSILQQGHTKVYVDPEWVNSDPYGRMFAVCSKHVNWNEILADARTSELDPYFWDLWDYHGDEFECMMREVCLSEEFLSPGAKKEPVKLQDSFRSAKSMMEFACKTAGAWGEATRKVLAGTPPKVAKSSGLFVLAYGIPFKNDGYPVIECFCLFHGESEFQHFVLHPQTLASTFFCHGKFGDTVLQELAKEKLLPKGVNGYNFWRLENRYWSNGYESARIEVPEDDDPVDEATATPAELWKKWEFCADYPDQWMRRKRADSVTEEKLKEYNTTLRHCDCPDFEKRGVPCKHMYKLAIDMGVQA